VLMPTFGEVARSSSYFSGSGDVRIRGLHTISGQHAAPAIGGSTAAPSGSSTAPHGAPQIVPSAGAPSVLFDMRRLMATPETLAAEAAAGITPANNGIIIPPALPAGASVALRHASGFAPGPAPSAPPPAPAHGYPADGYDGYPTASPPHLVTVFGGTLAVGLGMHAVHSGVVLASDPYALESDAVVTIVEPVVTTFNVAAMPAFTGGWAPSPASVARQPSTGGGGFGGLARMASGGGGTSRPPGIPHLMYSPHPAASAVIAAGATAASEGANSVTTSPGSLPPVVVIPPPMLALAKRGVSAAVTTDEGMMTTQATGLMGGDDDTDDDDDFTLPAIKAAVGGWPGGGAIPTPARGAGGFGGGGGGFAGSMRI